MIEICSAESCQAIRHAFFGRRDGVSHGLYDSLNCGLGTKDDPEAVRENRARVATALGAAPENLVTLYQVHSPTCLTIAEPFRERPQADAMVTAMPGLALGILAADCAPVLFSGEDAAGRPVIGAAHAGWKGALGGVLENTVEAMRKLGAVSVIATIGPCIGPESYEVGAEFPLPFLAEHPSSAVFFRKGRFDLPGYVTYRLKHAGVTDIANQNADTYARDGEYFSYRRSVHRGEPDYGRQLAAVIIRE